jgi:hypothetical protein
MAGVLTWQLCDLDDVVLKTIRDRRPGGKVYGGVNKGRGASLSVSLEDPVVDVLSAQDTQLRVLRDGWTQPLFKGRVVVPQGQASAEAAEGYTINALDPFAHLEVSFHKGTLSGGTKIPTRFAGVDQSQIMWSLIDALDTGHGIQEGSLPASVSRDRSYIAGKQIAEALVQMSEVINGPDFELVPLMSGGSATFNTYYPRQGADLTDTVVFEYGYGDQTALSFAPAPSGELLRNRCLAVGQDQGDGTHLVAIAEHAGSIAQYGGVFEEVLAFSDISVLATLGEHATAVVAEQAFPIPYFDFAAGEDGPVFAPSDEDGEFWQGDDIKVMAKLPRDAEAQPYTGRVTDWELTEGQAGEIVPKLTCQPIVDDAAVSLSADAWTLPVDVETP